MEGTRLVPALSKGPHVLRAKSGGGAGLVVSMRGNSGAKYGRISRPDPLLRHDSQNYNDVIDPRGPFPEERP